MKLLAIDTSTEACSAALYIKGETKSRYELAPRRHAELILPMVDSLLSEAQLSLNQLDGLAFGRGPGAFTGVRIATGIIQGLAFAADLPVVPISSLAALAQGAHGKAENIVTAIDARMHEIYCATYQFNANGIAELIGEENVSPPGKAIIPEIDTCFGIGSGWSSYAEQLSSLLGDKLSGYDGNCFPNAVHTAILAVEDLKRGKSLPAEQALPVYLRNKVTQ